MLSSLSVAGSRLQPTGRQQIGRPRIEINYCPRIVPQHFRSRKPAALKPPWLQSLARCGDAVSLARSCGARATFLLEEGALVETHR
jgi:hypothetical protein